MRHTINKYSEDGFEVVELKNDCLTARIAVGIGNTLFSLEREGDALLYFPFSLKEYAKNTKLAGNPFMHPWANRLEGDYITLQQRKYDFPMASKPLLYRDANDLPLHGLLLKSPDWRTLETEEEEGACMHLAEFIFEENSLCSVFPFRHSIQIRHRLQGYALMVETTVFNRDDKPMPISFGFHPYLLIDQQRRAQYQLYLPAKNYIEVNEKMIPNGKEFPKEQKWNFKEEEICLLGNAFDDGFSALNHDSGYSILQLNDISILSDTNYPFVQVYAPAQKDKPYVCLEPMTAPTNALNTDDCDFVEPHAHFSAAFKFMAV